MSGAHRDRVRTILRMSLRGFTRPARRPSPVNERRGLSVRVAAAAHCRPGIFRHRTVHGRRGDIHKPGTFMKRSGLGAAPQIASITTRLVLAWSISRRQREGAVATQHCLHVEPRSGGTRNAIGDEARYEGGTESAENSRRQESPCPKRRGLATARMRLCRLEPSDSSRGAKLLRNVLSARGKFAKLELSSQAIESARLRAPPFVRQNRSRPRGGETRDARRHRRPMVPRIGTLPSAARSSSPSRR